VEHTFVNSRCRQYLFSQNFVNRFWVTVGAWYFGWSLYSLSYSLKSCLLRHVCSVSIHAGSSPKQCTRGDDLASPVKASALSSWSQSWNISSDDRHCSVTEMTIWPHQLRRVHYEVVKPSLERIKWWCTVWLRHQLSQAGTTALRFFF